MPFDSAGNVADIVMDGGSTVNRMNVGRLYEQYINSASRDVRAQLFKMTAISPNEKHMHAAVQALFDVSQDTFHNAYNYLLGYYKIITNKQYVKFSTVSLEDKIKHLAFVLKEFIYLYIPTDNQPELKDMVTEIQEQYPPVFGPVTYTGYSGKPVTTHENIRIGSVYMMLLEKTGDDWSAVSSGKLHHFGFLAPVNRAERHTQPYRAQPVRAFGESETRIVVSYCGQKAISEIMDRNGSPYTHKAVLQSILAADKPTNIKYAINRELVALGSSKPLQLINHLSFCAGWRSVYKPSKVNYS